jgi:hydroxymethylbilane synthase
MKLRLLSRESDLAKVQAHSVQVALQKINPDVTVEIHYTKTLGDKYRHKWEAYLAEHGETEENTKRKWTFELEEALAHHECDIALHSGKDIPYKIKHSTTLTPVLERETARDVLISKNNENLAELPFGAIIGTGSLRRRAQLLRLRPDLTIKLIRGNVPTRLEKLRLGTGKEGKLDAIVLAEAGLRRLEIFDETMHPFSIAEFVPAMNQGLLVAQHRTDDTTVATLLADLSTPAVKSIWMAERTCVEILEASCDTALGVVSWTEKDQIYILARGLSKDGTQCLEEMQVSGISLSAFELGKNIAHSLMKKGLLDILKK